MIEVHDLTKRYGAFTALKGVSFTAKPGEILGILGPNGAGKTTTMRILTGFMPPTEGKASIAGFDVLRDSMEVRRRVGYMPERVPLYPDMTVEGFVEFWAKLRGVKDAKKQAQVALEHVNLLDRRKSLVRKLSKGMRQRLGLAQALVHNPEVVILDEPTIGIDPQQVIEVRESVRALANNHTVLFSTHILSEAEQVCDRVIILNKGEVVAEGRPDELRRKLYPGEHLYVEIGNVNNEAILNLLRSIQGVSSVEAQGNGFAVRAKSRSDIRAQMSSRIHESGGKVLELRPVAMTLEDIFLDIVKRTDN
ncbi:MAG TPA: ABC transporter ATP-binding protein [Phototrophicaceae bacterium]|jgi:ABC-2 type transport system ATP-binding protein|nr:ABC transporter ATP-binding protein [Phototrophicaceae bacterium]